MDARAVKTAGSSSNVLLEAAAAVAPAPSAPTAAPSSSSSSAGPSSSTDVPLSSADAAPSSSTAVPTAVTPATLLEALKAQREWAKAIAFDSSGKVLAATLQPLDGEMGALTKLFDKREDTIAAGIVLLNEQYDVHRFHPPLLYGRRGDPVQEDGEGIAVCMATQKATGKPLYCLATYVYPTLSARAVPQLKEFCETHLANLA